MSGSKKKGASWEELVEASVNEAANNAAVHRRWSLEVALSLVTSPIEKALLVAFIGLADSESVPRVEVATGKYPLVFGEPNGWRELLVEMQKKVGAYSADFCLTLTIRLPFYANKGVEHETVLETKTSIYVEADGHDFHEKTKEQARHDKQRDRFFAKQGLTVVRFTGSEIYKSAEQCAEEALDLLVTRNDIDAAKTEADYEHSRLLRVKP